MAKMRIFEVTTDKFNIVEIRLRRSTAKKYIIKLDNY